MRSQPVKGSRCRLQNEILSSIKNHILFSKFIAEIKAAKYFSVIGNEITNTST